MSDPNNLDEAAVDLALSGTPDHVIDALFPSRLHAAVGSVRDALTAMAIDLEPVTPPAELRGKIESCLTQRATRVGRTVVAVLDMIEDYLTPGRPLFVPRARHIVEAVRARIVQARRDGDPVVFLVDRHEPGDPELESWPLHALAGTSGGRVIPELAPGPDERVIPHRTFSCFWETALETTLRTLNATKLVLTGCSTEIQIMATATDALMRGYRVEVPVECQAGLSDVAEHTVLTTLKAMRPVEAMPRPNARGA